VAMADVVFSCGLALQAFGQGTYPFDDSWLRGGRQSGWLVE
jgi:hypothetical protein